MVIQGYLGLSSGGGKGRGERGERDRMGKKNKVEAARGGAMGMMGIFFFSPLSATLTSLLTHTPPSPVKKRVNKKTWLDLNT